MVSGAAGGRRSRELLRPLHTLAELRNREFCRIHAGLDHGEPLQHEVAMVDDVLGLGMSCAPPRREGDRSDDE